MDVKKCFKCLQDKTISEFYKHKQMADGYLNKCKSCAKIDVAANRIDKVDYYRAYSRKKNALPKYVEQRRINAERWKKDPELRKRKRELTKTWQENNAVKRAAHVLTGNAIKYGRLVKQPCEVCGGLAAEAHHDDYAKPLDVRWLCRKHHAEHHKNEREKMRRT